MKAKVRVAPMEHWCDWMKSDMPSNAHEIVGLEVAILTNTMITEPLFEACIGKRWVLEQESQDRVDEIIHGRSLSSKSYWCEHMLEMD